MIRSGTGVCRPRGMKGPIDPAPPVNLLFAALLLSAAIGSIALLARRNYLLLPKLPVSTNGQLPDHVVIIPARDEAGRIARTVASFPQSVVVVIDDRSTDTTAQAALAAGAHVRSAEPLQKGWKGKSNACWTGALYTESDWILFADAGTWYDPAFLPSLLDHAVAWDLSAVSVFPRQHCPSLFEKLMLPYLSGVHFIGVDPAGANNPLSSSVLACGQCFLVRRDAYEFVQGHRAVAASVADDVALARLFKRHRMKYRVLRDESMAHARARDSLGAIWLSFEKLSFKFVRLGRLTEILIALSALVLTAWLPMLAALLYDGHTAAAFFFLFVPSLAWLPWYRSVLPAMMAPLAICVFPLICISAFAKDLFGIRTTRRGRSV